MREKDYEKLIKTVSMYFYEGIKDLLEKSYDGDEEYLDKVDSHIRNIKRIGVTWSKEKLDVMLSVLKLQNDSTEIEELLSYFDHTIYGWQGENYLLHNGCLNSGSHCRFNHYIPNSPETTSEVFEDIEGIFLHEKYGAITTYLFGYCLAALFSSRLKNQQRAAPYFLQVACKWNSNTHRLVHEVVHICDINTGIFECCSKTSNHIRGYRECKNNHMILCPSGSIEKALNSLIYYRDIPVIVEGYEEMKLYEGLLQEIANIPNKNKKLDIGSKFNILPIFICPAIRSQFHNTFNMNLIDLEIEDEYLDLILKNKQRLASWAFELIMSTKDYFGINNSSEYSSKTDAQKLIELRNHKKDAPLFYDLDDYINGLLTNLGYRTQITLRDRNNASCLLYFFSHYMDVFEKSIRLAVGEKFLYKGEYKEHQYSELIGKINDKVKESIFALHQRFAPTRPEKFNIDIDLDEDKVKKRRIREKGIKYAKEIIKYYKSYDVQIEILPNIQYKKGRYVFGVKLLPGTDLKLISRYSEEVKRMLELEFFKVDITSNEIKVVASENPLKENSLANILESDLFKKSRMEIPYAVGYDILGEMVIADVGEFPHLLIGGTSGSGKSSAIHSLLMSIVYRQPANKVKLLLFDFGSSGLKMFDKVPHMLQSTIRTSEIEKGILCLKWLQKEMETRLKEKDSNDEKKFVTVFRKWPSIVCVIDEFPTLIRRLTAEKHNKKGYQIIEDLLERARKVKIHLVLAAQNSSKSSIDIRTTNLGARIAFRCTNRYDSQAIIESSDAVNLSGKGSMYFKCYHYEGLKRLQGSYMPPKEITNILDNIKFSYDERYEDVKIQFNLLQEFGNSEIKQVSVSVENEDEILLLKIVEWLQDKETVSNNKLKQKFEMGYDRANEFLGRLEEAGIVSKNQKKVKLPRIVDSNKVKEFLSSHSYTADVVEMNLEQAAGIPCEIKSVQEQDVEPSIEMSDAQTEDSNSTLSQPKLNQCIKIDPNAIKKYSDRFRFKKKHDH